MHFRRFAFLLLKIDHYTIVAERKEFWTQVAKISSVGKWEHARQSDNIEWACHSEMKCAVATLVGRCAFGRCSACLWLAGALPPHSAALLRDMDRILCLLPQYTQYTPVKRLHVKHLNLWHLPFAANLITVSMRRRKFCIWTFEITPERPVAVRETATTLAPEMTKTWWTASQTPVMSSAYRVIRFLHALSPALGWLHVTGVFAQSSLLIYLVYYVVFVCSLRL